MAKNIRPLSLGDCEKSYFELLSHLTHSPNIGYERFKDIFKTLSDDYIIHVIEEKNKIIATGTLLLEKKFIREGQRVGHIEDIVIHPDYQKLGLGRLIVNSLIEKAKKKKCYKVSLNCDNDKVPFYQKLGFDRKGQQLTIYY